MDPEPLVGMAAGEVFDDAREELGVGEDVGVEIAGADELERRLEAKAVFAQVAIPEAVTGDDSGVGLQGQAGDTSGGASGNAEEIHEDAIVGEGVEVEKNADRTAGAQDAKNRAHGVGFVHGNVAGKTAVAVDKGVDAGIVERANEKVQWETEESLGGRAELPGTHMPSEIENAFAAVMGGGEVFETVGNDEAVDGGAVEVMEMDEVGGHPTEMTGEMAKDAAATRVGPIREGDAEVDEAGAAQGRTKHVGKTHDKRSKGAGGGARKEFEEF